MAAYFNNPIFQLSGLNSVIGNQCPSNLPPGPCEGCNLLFLVCSTKFYLVATKTISSPALLYMSKTKIYLFFKVLGYSLNNDNI